MVPIASAVGHGPVKMMNGRNVTNAMSCPTFVHTACFWETFNKVGTGFVLVVAETNRHFSVCPVRGNVILNTELLKYVGSAFYAALFLSKKLVQVVKRPNNSASPVNAAMNLTTPV